MKFTFFFLLQKNEDNSDNKNHRDVITLNNADSVFNAR